MLNSLGTLRHGAERTSKVISNDRATLNQEIRELVEEKLFLTAMREIVKRRMTYEELTGKIDQTRLICPPSGGSTRDK